MALNGCGLSRFPLAPRSGERVPERNEGGRGALRFSKEPSPGRSLRSRPPSPASGRGESEYAARASHHLLLSNSRASSPGFGRAPGCPLSLSSPGKVRGDGAQGDAGARSPGAPVARLAIGPISETAEMTGRNGAGAPSGAPSRRFSLRRRAALSGPSGLSYRAFRFRLSGENVSQTAVAERSGSASSWQEALVPSGRSPAAARVPR